MTNMLHTKSPYPTFHNPMPSRAVLPFQVMSVLVELLEMLMQNQEGCQGCVPSKFSGDRKEAKSPGSIFQDFSGGQSLGRSLTSHPPKRRGGSRSLPKAHDVLGGNSSVTVRQPLATQNSAQLLRNSGDGVHLTQFRHHKYNPNGPLRSSNCGPASLTMALVNLGLQGKSSNPQSLITANRMSMTGTNNSSRWTTMNQVFTGAKNAGARTHGVSTVSDIGRTLGQGGQVILAGNPNANGAYGRQNGITYSDGHFITVSDYDKKSGLYTVNDPLSRKGAIQVSGNQLQAYMSDDNAQGTEGVAVYRS